jgi:hypothetical protein
MGQRLGDQRAVEAPILNEDLIGARAGHDHARQIDARHIALQRLRIANRQPVLALQAHAQCFKELEVGMIAGHGEDKVVLHGLAALGRLH